MQKHVNYTYLVRPIRDPLLHSFEGKRKTHSFLQKFCFGLCQLVHFFRCWTKVSRKFLKAHVLRILNKHANCEEIVVCTFNFELTSTLTLVSSFLIAFKTSAKLFLAEPTSGGPWASIAARILLVATSIAFDIYDETPAK